MVRKTKNDILQGTLALLVLKTLASQGRMHGYAITAHIQRVSNELLRVEEGSLYPALHRMEDDGWVRAEWDDKALGISPDECEKQLLEGDPRIAVLRNKRAIVFTMFMNDPGDEKLVARRMREIFGSARKG